MTTETLIVAGVIVLLVVVTFIGLGIVSVLVMKSW